MTYRALQVGLEVEQCLLLVKLTRVAGSGSGAPGDGLPCPLLGVREPAAPRAVLERALPSLDHAATEPGELQKPLA